MNRLVKQWDILMTKYPKERVFGMFVYGSQNYDLAHENSDLDVRALIFPTAKEMMRAAEPISHTVETEYGSISIVDIRLEVKRWFKQNPNSLEIFFTDYFIINNDYNDLWSNLLDLRERIAHYDEWRACASIIGMMYDHKHAWEKTLNTKSLARIDHYSWMIREYLVNRASYKSALQHFSPEHYHRIRLGEELIDPEAAIEAAQEFRDKYACEELDAEVFEMVYNIFYKIMTRYLRFEVLL